MLWSLLRPILPYALLVVGVAAVGGWISAQGHRAGAASVQVRWDAERSAVEAAQATERAATAERLATLAGEIEALRARPERVRTITRTVHVAADAECLSTPESVRRLWDATTPGADGAAARAAALADDQVPAVASDGRGGAGAD